jgi:transposase
MAQKPLSMRQIKEILRLKYQHQLSVRAIARSCGLSRSTVGDYLQRAKLAGLNWPLPEELNEAQLLERILGVTQAPNSNPLPRPLPEWPKVHQELRRPNVTLQLVWQEYHRSQPEGYGYSRFCQLYQRWANTLEPSLRQVHVPGEKMFVDWAGQTVPIRRPGVETVTEASLFVAVLGASNKTFVEAFADQQLASWITGHCHAYQFYGGVARITVPDNPRTAVIHACRYEPVLHRVYQEMAEHFGTVILPARAARPKDKAKVEAGVQIAQRQILAALRDQSFFSVGALNQAIRPLLDRLNAQPFQKLEGSRNSWFEAEEKAKLLPLPATPFQLATWAKATVNIDYHVVVDKHYYSVPYGLIHQAVEARLTDSTVEIFHQGKRVAAHPRSHQPGRFTTLEEHRPKAHQRHLQWTPGRIVQWAAQTGPCCARVVEEILASRPHPEQGFRSCLGIIRLGKGAGQPRLEAACRRALHFKTCSYSSIKSILERHLEHQPLEQELPLTSPAHENVRGGPYYTQPT